MNVKSLEYKKTPGSYHFCCRIYSVDTLEKINAHLRIYIYYIVRVDPESLFLLMPLNWVPFPLAPTNLDLFAI